MPQNASATASPASRWTPAVRTLVSALILFHVLAVFVGPWGLPPQSSNLGLSIAQWLQPYLQPLYLDNGYRFFAPEPGPGHLVRYELTLPDGKQVDGFFPDRQTAWPRLLYHRYFMLSEYLSSITHPGAAQNPKVAETADAYLDSYAKHLEAKYGADYVKLYVRTHRLPTTEEVRGGMQLDDPSLYSEELVVNGSSKHD